jgi:hypothetical protein
MPTLRQVMTALEVSGSPDSITTALRRQLSATQRPFAPRVRAAILNTPSKGTVPYRQPPGLRLRIAACVQTWAEIHGNVVSAGVEVNASRMPSGQKSLPLMLNGDKIWRHPLFGDRERWYGQDSHPYFAQAVALYGPAGRNAVSRAADAIAAKFDALAG